MMDFNLVLLHVILFFLIWKIVFLSGQLFFTTSAFSQSFTILLFNIVHGIS